MLRKKQEVDRERSQLYPQNAERVVEVSYVEKAVLEESEVVV